MSQTLRPDTIHANYDARLEALAGRTAESLIAPTHAPRQTFIAFAPNVKVPLRRRIWRAIQKRMPW